MMMMMTIGQNFAGGLQGQACTAQNIRRHRTPTQV